MSNFSPYLSIPSFAAFAPIAESAEKILSIDPAACVLKCRRAMEAAVKWMYAVDGSLVMPWMISSSPSSIPRSSAASWMSS